jgi:uncharacterized protein (DUF1697 family)
MILEGSELTRLVSRAPFARGPGRPGITRFVSILARRPRAAPELPLRLPPRGKWLLELLSIEGRFVFGRYRRDMKAIRYLGMLDRLFGVAATTRNWATVDAICRALATASHP